MAPCGKRYARLQTRRLSLHKDHGEGTIVLLLGDRQELPTCARLE